MTDTLAKANLFNDYFNSVFSPFDTEPPPPGLDTFVPIRNESSVVTLSVTEVQKVLSNLDPSKSPGSDGVTARLLKELADDIATSLTWLFNQSLSNAVLPTSWKDENLIRVHTLGPKNIVSTYICIALL